jgi:hypothetical protein
VPGEIVELAALLGLPDEALGQRLPARSRVPAAIGVDVERRTWRGPAGAG